MDFDVLNRIGDVMKRCVIAQDTTELWELLEPNAELVGFQSESGEISEAIATKQAKPKSVRGALAVGRCTERIFAWLSQGPCIQQPNTEAEVKRRKVVQKEASAAAPGGGHRRTQHAMIQDQGPADPSTFSTVTVTYGRPNFTVIDVLFVSEEGKVAMITRCLADPPTESKPLAAWQQECLSFMHKTRQTVNAPHTRPPALDYTFTGVVEPMDLLRLKPVSGRPHRAAGIEVKREETAAQSDFMQGPGKQKKQLIKAKNRDGEEEAYEFSLDGADKRLPGGIPAGDAGTGNKEEDRLRALAAELPSKYVGEAVRVSSNSITDGTQIVRVLRMLVSNYYMSIQWLDLSCNKITCLPPSMATLPLKTLYLHSNRITAWSEVEKLKELKSLTAVTLFGNDIATDTPDYKSVALAVLLHVVDKQVPLKSLDFVALSTVDRQLSGHHARRNGGQALPSPRRAGRSVSPRR